MLALTITHAFGAYQVGQTVTDEAEIAAICAGSNQDRVVRTNLPDPKPEPKAEHGAEAGDRKAGENGDAAPRATGDDPEPTPSDKSGAKPSKRT